MLGGAEITVGTKLTEDAGRVVVTCVDDAVEIGSNDELVCKLVEGIDEFLEAVADGMTIVMIVLLNAGIDITVVL